MAAGSAATGDSAVVVAAGVDGTVTDALVAEPDVAHYNSDFHCRMVAGGNALTAAVAAPAGVAAVAMDASVAASGAVAAVAGTVPVAVAADRTWSHSVPAGSTSHRCSFEKPGTESFLVIGIDPYFGPSQTRDRNDSHCYCHCHSHRQQDAVDCTYHRFVGWKD